MRVVHVLRKYDPAEWGGTETALQHLLDALQQQGVRSTVYAPRLPQGAVTDPLAAGGCAVRRFRAWLPIWGVPQTRRKQLVAVGGNLMSFDLLPSLWREPDVAAFHSHTLGRLGGIALAAARQRRVPFVVSVHGGVYDLPDALRLQFRPPKPNGWEWGRIFGLLLGSRRILSRADAILTCNPREAALIRERHPDRRVSVQSHGVPAALYRSDQREAARAAFPMIRDRDLLAAVGRIDPVKNQGWLIEQAPELFRRQPRALLIFAGACTDHAYAEALREKIARSDLGRRVVFAGGLPPADPRLIGLMQEAKAVVLPSISETFGLVILEAWAAGTPVIASRTSGASALIEQGQNGWLFELDRPETFHKAVEQVLSAPGASARLVAAGQQRVAAEYDRAVLAGRMKRLYEELIEERHALHYSARR